MVRGDRIGAEKGGWAPLDGISPRCGPARGRSGTRRRCPSRWPGRNPGLLRPPTSLLLTTPVVTSTIPVGYGSFLIQLAAPRA